MKRTTTILAILLLAQAVRGQDAPPDPRLAERDRLAAKARHLATNGDPTHASEAFARLLALDREFFGEVHETTLNTYQWLAWVEEALGDFAAARQSLEKVLEIRTALSGAGHWKTTDARLDLEDLDLRARLSPDDRELLRRAQAEEDRLSILWRQDRLAEVVEPAQALLALHERVFGREHRRTLETESRLATVYRETCDFQKALPLMQRALATAEGVLGPEHPGTARTLAGLADLYQAMGDYAGALPLYERSLSIRERALGPEDPATAENLVSLAGLHLSMGEDAKALPLCRRALAIDEKVLGPEHLATSTSLRLLAMALAHLEKYEEALPLLQRALPICEAVTGPESATTATLLLNLVVLYCGMEDYERALPPCERALAILTEKLGPEHPLTAVGLQKLAVLHASMGEYPTAVPLLERALGIEEGALGREHPLTVQTLHDLGALHGEHGRPDLACPLAVRALGAVRSGLAALSVVQAERQQLRMFRDTRWALDLCLSTGKPEDSGALHAAVLATKGLVFRRQAFLRAQRSLPELSGLFSEYEGVCRRLSNLLFATPGTVDAAARREAIRELAARQEKIEAELSKRSEAFREERASLGLAPADLAAALPPYSVLVDFLAYDHLLPRAPGAKGRSRTERRYVAFVVRPGAEVARVDLGPAEPIDVRIAEWRTAARGGGIPAAGADLRRLLWEPVAPHLGGAKTVLLSPDGALSRIPFAALPGEAPGSYLLDDFAFATVAVPRLLPGLLARAGAKSGPESLLLVGEVDFGAPTGAPMKWEPLPATRAEMLAVRDSFEMRFPQAACRTLRGKAATEEAFREAAGASRWLHVATHGFFAPKEVRSALAEAGEAVSFHPGLLSGIVLAGANRPADPEADDGILTALDVASLDLTGVEMAVLSACETGLGEVAGGEGVLGLQRAFQIAGARSTVTSLWTVNDQATNLLMTLFYEKLWGEGLPRAQALRQAQLALIEDEGFRGLRLPDQEQARRLPPQLWAAFVLAGDPR